MFTSTCVSEHLSLGTIGHTESRYAMIELECLAASWAMQKCHVYLAGISFSLVVDHQPLVPIFNGYSLDQVENPRLQRLSLKSRVYQFQTCWKKGSQNAVADALSRATVTLEKKFMLCGK